MYRKINIERKLKPHIIHSFTPKGNFRVYGNILLEYGYYHIDYLICLLNTHTVAEGNA